MRRSQREYSALTNGFSETDGWKTAFAKVAVLIPLGALFGPGAPDPDLGRSQIRV